MIRETVFPANLVFQLLVFVVAQAAAWANMLSGRFPVGFAEFAILWVFADVLLVLQFVAHAPPGAWLFAFQLVALLIVLEYVVRRWLGTRVGVRERRQTQYAKALDSFMAGDDVAALALFRRLAILDPWDAASACMVGTIQRRAGRRWAAHGWLTLARMRARTPVDRQEIDEELRWLTKETKAQKSPVRGPQPPAPRRGRRRPREAAG